MLLRRLSAQQRRREGGNAEREEMEVEMEVEVEVEVRREYFDCHQTPAMNSAPVEIGHTRLGTRRHHHRDAEAPVSGQRTFHGASTEIGQTIQMIMMQSRRDDALRVVCSDRR